MMLRLSTPGFQRFVQADSLDLTFGGGEANVAVSLANYGLESYFVSKFPSNEIGQAAVNHLRRFGVSDRFVVRGGDRVGIYFLESGASQRNSKVIYDRAQSAITTLTESELDVDAIFDGATWFHWTGITAALGPVARQTLVSLCKAAQEAGVTVSCDLNYREKLWTTVEAQQIMRPLMKYVDVCIANEEDAQKSLGMGLNKNLAVGTDLDAGSGAGARKAEDKGLAYYAYEEMLKELKNEYGFSAVAVTLRESHSASRNGWSAMMLDDKECREPYRSTRYDIQIVDRVGGGDAFAGGLIAGLLKKNDTKEALEFAVAASCLKQTIPGDFNAVSEQEVDRLMTGAGSGRIDR